MHTGRERGGQVGHREEERGEKKKERRQREKSRFLLFDRSAFRAAQGFKMATASCVLT
jgi:hypothetical protein